MRHALPLLLFTAICRTAVAAPEAATDAYSERHAVGGSAAVHSALHGEAFDEAPRQRAWTMVGMGEVSFPISTTKPEAQAFFNQGVAQLHTYYYFEAERSFREAAKIDPECAMAYWGMAMANGNNRTRATGFLAVAEARRKRLTDREQKYLDALAAHYREGRNDEQRRQEYIEGLETITLAHPEDIEAKAFLAGELIWDPTSRVAVDGLIEAVLRKQPMHPGAHHYRIHLWDGHKPEQALASAQVYAKAAPGIAHAWHMPGHIYNGLSRWREASYQQEASARIDHAHISRRGLMPFQIHNYAHNQHYLIANLSHLGRVRAAVAFSRNLVETPRDPERNNKKNSGSAQRNGRASLMRIYVRYERWDDLLADPLLDWSDVPEEQAWKAYSRGLAYLGKGDLEKARAEAVALDKIATDAAAAKPPAPGADIMETARLELRGRLTVAEGKVLEGFELLNRGAAKAGRFDGDLSGYPRPFHEVLGQVHLQTHNWGLAQSCFEKVLAARKHSLVSLAGLVEAYARDGKHEQAAKAWREFEEAWQYADPDLPLRARLQPLIAGEGRRTARVEISSGNRDRETVPTRQVALRPLPSPGNARSRAGVSIPPGDDSLEALGPRLWSPRAAARFALVDTAGKTHRLEEYRGRSLVLAFYLGGDCDHCVQQLRALGKEAAAIEALGGQILAVSGDTPERNRALLAGKLASDLTLPLLSDPGREAARRYGAWDDFEGLPLHATFLIDRHGNVRWQRISAQPFMDMAFLKEELERVNRFGTPAEARGSVQRAQ